MSPETALPLISSAYIYGVDDPRLPYLATRVFPGAQQLRLAVGQDSKKVVAELPPETQWFVWHAMPTYKSSMPRHRDALIQTLQDRSIVSINARVTDISKRHLQTVLAGLGLPTTEAADEGPPEEKLFLKSNLNYGGRAERLLAQEVRDYFGIATPHKLTPEFSTYRVAERQHVQPIAYNLADVFVERFIANKDDQFYRAFVLFDAVVLSRIVADGVIKKALDAKQREDCFLTFSEESTGFPSAPDDLTRRIMVDVASFCKAFGLEMGAVDVLTDDKNVPYIIDANSTAWGGENCDRPGFLDHLRSGLQGVRTQ
ncbi:MAG: hypothetical protein RH942_03815 [Kiloniellaceae bacterium]